MVKKWMSLLPNQNNWIEYNKGTVRLESGFYWVYDVYYYGAVIAYFESTYDNGRGIWEVWRETDGGRIYRQTDIFVTHYCKIADPPKMDESEAKRIFNLQLEND